MWFCVFLLDCFLYGMVLLSFFMKRPLDVTILKQTWVTQTESVRFLILITWEAVLYYSISFCHRKTFISVNDLLLWNVVYNSLLLMLFHSLISINNFHILMIISLQHLLCRYLICCLATFVYLKYSLVEFRHRLQNVTQLY